MQRHSIATALDKTRSESVKRPFLQGVKIQDCCSSVCALLQCPSLECPSVQRWFPASKCELYMARSLHLLLTMEVTPRGPVACSQPTETKSNIENIFGYQFYWLRCRFLLSVSPSRLRSSFKRRNERETVVCSKEPNPRHLQSPNHITGARRSAMSTSSRWGGTLTGMK